MKYRVLSITNNPPKYPESAMDSAEFPELVEDVEDEQELFIMDETGTFYKAIRQSASQNARFRS